MTNIYQMLCLDIFGSYRVMFLLQAIEMWDECSVAEQAEIGCLTKWSKRNSRGTGTLRFSRYWSVQGRRPQLRKRHFEKIFLKSNMRSLLGCCIHVPKTQNFVWQSRGFSCWTKLIMVGAWIWNLYFHVPYKRKAKKNVKFKVNKI